MFGNRYLHNATVNAYPIVSMYTSGTSRLKASYATISDPNDWPRRVMTGYMLLRTYLRVERYTRTTVGGWSSILNRVYSQ